MSASATTPNLKLPQYSADDKPTYLVDTNDAYSKIDEAVGTVTALANATEVKVTNLQTAQGNDRTDITTMQGDINLIKTNQTAVNQHLTDVDATNNQQNTEIGSLDARVTALEDGGGSVSDSYTKAESDAKYALKTGLAATDANVSQNANALDALENRLIDKQIPFKFGVDDEGNYGYYKAGADTVTPFLSKGASDMYLVKIESSGTANLPEDIAENFDETQWDIYVGAASGAFAVTQPMQLSSTSSTSDGQKTNISGGARSATLSISAGVISVGGLLTHATANNGGSGVSYSTTSTIPESCIVLFVRKEIS